MNANYGLFPQIACALRSRDKKLAMAERALAEHMRWRESAHLSEEPAGCQSVA